MFPHVILLGLLGTTICLHYFLDFCLYQLQWNTVSSKFRTLSPILVYSSVHASVFNHLFLAVSLPTGLNRYQWQNLPHKKSVLYKKVEIR